MKHLFNIALFSLVFGAFGQRVDFTTKWFNRILNEQVLHKHDFKDSLSKHDFGTLWTRLDNSYTFGYIGEHFQRIRIKIISAKKDSINPNLYKIFGKSMVKNNICQFSGTIEITSIRVNKKNNQPIEEDSKKNVIKKQGVLLAKYYLSEDTTQLHAGVFEGALTSLWWIDKSGLIRYDDIEIVADSYRNNQFVGTWMSYKNEIKKTCNWGDYRVPFSGDLDIGAGLFSPDDQYLKYGWQTYRDAYFSDNEKARNFEAAKWWR